MRAPVAVVPADLADLVVRLPRLPLMARLRRLLPPRTIDQAKIAIIEQNQETTEEVVSFFCLLRQKFLDFFPVMEHTFAIR